MRGYALWLRGRVRRGHGFPAGASAVTLSGEMCWTPVMSLQAVPGAVPRPRVYSVLACGSSCPEVLVPLVPCCEGVVFSFSRPGGREGRAAGPGGCVSCGDLCTGAAARAERAVFIGKLLPGRRPGGRYLLLYIVSVPPPPFCT